MLSCFAERCVEKEIGGGPRLYEHVFFRGARIAAAPRPTDGYQRYFYYTRINASKAGGLLNSERRMKIRTDGDETKDADRAASRMRGDVC